MVVNATAAPTKQVSDNKLPAVLLSYFSVCQQQVHVPHRTRPKVSNAGLVPAKASNGLKASPVFDDAFVAPMIYHDTANSAIYISIICFYVVLFSSPPHLFQNKAFNGGPASISGKHLKLFDHSCNLNH